jgi:hypothetical protein
MSPLAGGSTPPRLSILLRIRIFQMTLHAKTTNPPDGALQRNKTTSAPHPFSFCLAGQSSFQPSINKEYQVKKELESKLRVAQHSLDFADKQLLINREDILIYESAHPSVITEVRRMERLKEATKSIEYYEREVIAREKEVLVLEKMLELYSTAEVA